MHFQIFVPGNHNGKQNSQILEDVGLTDLVQGAYSNTGMPDQSPNNQAGTVFGWVSGHVGFRPEGITWVPSIATGEREAGAYYVGFWDGDLPKPEELQRPEKLLYRGELITLADGNRWLIPSFKRLPCDLVPDADGKLVSETKPRFRHLEELGSFWNARLDEGNVRFSELADVSIHIMRLNYRITPEVAFQLRIFDTDTIIRPMLIFSGSSAERAEMVSVEVGYVE